MVVYFCSGWSIYWIYILVSEIEEFGWDCFGYLCGSRRNIFGATSRDLQEFTWEQEVRRFHSLYLSLFRYRVLSTTSHFATQNHFSSRKATLYHQ
jgi:hypothetical protein